MSGLERSICLGINLENNLDEPDPSGKVFTMQRARDGVYEGLIVFFAPSCRTQCLLASPEADMQPTVRTCVSPSVRGTLRDSVLKWRRARAIGRFHHSSPFLEFCFP